MISDEEAKQIKEHLLGQIAKLPPEQVPGLKEKVEAMNNEELEEFIQQQTKGQCVFCQIRDSKVKSHKVFENEKFLAILDIMPATRGHCIILPKQHIQFFNQLTDDDTKEMILLAKKIIPIIINLTGAQSADLYIAQGIEQRIPHLALNLIPRYEKDDVHFEWQKKPAQEQDLQELSKKISSALQKIEEASEVKKQEVKKKEDKSEAQQMMKHIKERVP